MIISRLEKTVSAITGNEPKSCAISFTNNRKITTLIENLKREEKLLKTDRALEYMTLKSKPKAMSWKILPISASK